MLRAVLDTNVFISAAIQPAGSPGQLLKRFLVGSAFEIVLSPAIVDEVLRALAYPKIGKHLRVGTSPALWFEDVLVLADLVAGELRAARVCADPDDDKIIAAALEGLADYVVTGDRQLLAVEQHEGIRLVTPRAFLDLITPSSGTGR